jgi:hypothetical protein
MLESSFPSLSSSTSHLRFLRRLAGGDIGGGVSAGLGWAGVGALVAAGTGGGQAVVAAEGHRGRRRRRLRLLAAVGCVGNRQCSVTSW